MNLQESQTVEFKESWRDEYLKTVCAFTNTDGGTFYIGVNDKGEVIGVDKVKKLMDDLPNKVMNSFGIFIGIHVAEENGLSYIQMNIPKNSTPVAYHGKFYVRCIIDSLRTQHLSRLRNKIMADIFYRSGKIEAWGCGTLKMIENAREGGYTEPVFAEFQDGILVTFEKKEFGDTINNADDTVNDTVNDDNGTVNGTVKAIDELILKQLTMENGISAPEIAKRIGRPLSTIKKYLGQMKKDGKIEFIGASKTGGYHIKK